MGRPRKQHGAALILFAAILILGFAAFLYARLGKWGEGTPTSQNVNGAVLQQAKQALIGYIAKEVLDLSEESPGRFPCPESPSDAGTTNEGRAAGNCAPTSANRTVGRLPWRTLGLDKLVDASAEPLWYAVSQTWVYNNVSMPLINAGTAGQFSFDGTSDVVAVIFAPGRPLSTTPDANQLAAGCVARNQSRSDRSHVSSGGNPDYRDYLECLNAASPIGTSFGVSVVDNATNVVLNDQAVTITAKEILNAIQGPLAERLQRTVAPLLSEFGDKWIAGGKFLPYAVSFSPPEANLLPSSFCGTGGQTEGLLPIADNSGICSSSWTGMNLSGDGITSGGCTTASSVSCSFTYYRLTALGQFLFGSGAASVTATLQATAPHAAANFRAPIAISDFSVTAGSATFGAFSLLPQTSGDAALSVQATVSSSNLCKDSLLGGLVCALLGGLVVTPQTVTFQFPQLSAVVLNGSKLSTGAKNGHAGPFALLSPAVDDPHYWFIQNQWYRYTYYAVSPSASAAQSGTNITVSGFPTVNGANNDKRFVLALMGPPVTGQTRSATAAMNQYVEGQNANVASPRTFAYTVYSVSGNDRLATCPYTDGASSC